MLERTFCILPGVGPKTEQTWWGKGVTKWDHAFGPESCLPPAKLRSAEDLIPQAKEALEQGNAHWFGGRLPSSEHWRLFNRFKDRTAYVDIETTGLDESSQITTIALYDGETVRTYVNGRNLDDFQNDILEYSLIVTYNGKCFDVPMIERFFQMRLEMGHIDMRYVLGALGYKGGLKACEKRFGLDRAELDGVDGYFAVLLWKEYEDMNDEQALETLLAYNVEDVLSLEHLLYQCWNMKVADTPFADSLRLDIPELGANPHTPDEAAVERVRSRFGW